VRAITLSNVDIGSCFFQKGRNNLFDLRPVDQLTNNYHLKFSMSPAYNRDSAYIACHIYNKKNHRPYFTDLEEVFRSYGGRPQWVKMNTLSYNEVQDLYPEFPQFI